MKDKIEGKSEFETLAEEKLKLDKSEKWSNVKGMAKAFIHEYCEFYADSIPKVQAKTKDVYCYAVPFRSVTEFWLHYQWSYIAEGGTSSEFGSERTFRRAYGEMEEEGLVQLTSSKGSFQTCAICNHALAAKKDAAKARDRASIEIIKKLQRVHLKQQQLERQHCENFIHLAKNLYVEGLPDRFYIGIDGQTAEATKGPILSNTTKHAYPKMENRNMGARIVCGPIDEYISICTGDLIPGGANVLIECVRIATEILAAKLAQLPEPLPLPKNAGYNFDNCGENKVN